MKIKMRNVLTAFLTAGILVSAAMQASAETDCGDSLTGESYGTAPVIDQGTCGDNLTWAFDHSGTLTISGEGEMWDYSSADNGGSTAPWNEYRMNIQKVEFSDTVTHIGKRAFCEYSGLTELVLPDNLTSIGEQAFMNCYGLTELVLPNHITSLGTEIFYGCSGLTKIVFPDSLVSIGDFAFCSCSGLTELDFPDTLMSIGIAAFDRCAELTELVFPKSLTSVGAAAFNCCENLKSVYFNGDAPEIGSSAFEAAHENFTIYYNPTASGWSAPEWNGYAAEPVFFENNEFIVTLPDIFKVNCSIDYGRNFTFILADDGQYYNYSDITAEIDGVSVPVIDNGDGSYTVENVTGDLVITGERTPKEYYILKDYPDPEKDAGHGFTSEQGGFTWIDYIEGADYRIVSSLYEDGTEFPIKVSQFYYNAVIDKVYYTLRFDVDWITQNATITYEEVPEDTVVCLENYTDCEFDGYREYAFSGEDYSIELLNPDTAKYSYVVTAMVNGKTVPVSGSNYVYTIEADDVDEGVMVIFAEQRKLCVDGTANHSFTQYIYNKDATCTEDGTRTAVCDNGCGEKDTVTASKTAFGHSFTDYITDAGGLTKTAECDNGCGKTDTVPVQAYYSGTCGDNLTWELSNGVLTISGTGEMWDYQQGWYNYKDQIRKLIINEGVTSVGEGTFKKCPELETIIFPDTLTSIGEGAFDGCTSIEELELPEGLTTVGDSAFARCESLEDVELPSTLTALADSMFDECSSLRSIDLPETVKSVGDRTFAYTPLRKITFPAGLEELIDGTFMGCDRLTEIRFTGDAPDFGDEIFEDVTATAYYPYKNPTWTSKELQNHGGTLTWIAVGSGAQLTFEAKTIYGSQSCTVDLYLTDAEKATSLAITDLEISSKYAEIVSAEWLLTDAVMSDVNLGDGSAVIAYDEAADMNGPVFRLHIDTERVTREYVDEILCSAVLEIGTNRIAVDVQEGELVILHAVPGDTNGDGYVTSADAIYLLRYTMLPDRYPLNGVWFDYDNDGGITADDAVYLLYHAMLPEKYPLAEKSDGGDTGFEDDPYLKGDILYVEPEEDGTVWYYYSSREILPDASEFEEEFDDAKYYGTTDVDGGGIEKIPLDEDVLEDFPYVVVSFLPEEYENSSEKKFSCPVILESSHIDDSSQADIVGEVILVGSYLGLSDDGYPVIDGYFTEILDYTSIRIESINGFKTGTGDYFYYFDEESIAKNFASGMAYVVTSYNSSKNTYCIELASAEKVRLESIGDSYCDIAYDAYVLYRKMRSEDRYIILYEGEKLESIKLYEGILPEEIIIEGDLVETINHLYVFLNANVKDADILSD